MARVVYIPPSLYEALKAEGFVLPDECGDCQIDLPVDGVPQLVCRINITSENVAQIGRALVRLATSRTATVRTPQYRSAITNEPVDVADEPETE